MRKIDFIGASKKFFIFSIALMVIVVIGVAVFNVQLDIQFKGGSIIKYTYEGTLDEDQLNRFEEIVQVGTAADISTQQSTDLATGRETVVITLPGNEGADVDVMQSVNAQLQEEFPDSAVQVLESSNVDPTMGREFLLKCLTAVVLASLLMTVYVWLRFRRIGGLSAGVMGVVALVHDVIVVFGVFVLLGIPLNDNFVAVVLTILGYSLNDTIVIYDRIRENRQKMGAKAEIGELVNVSINQSFKRTLMTSITTVTAMLIVTIVAYVYNVNSIISFSLPLVVGLASGSYSSICLAGPLWVKWQERKMRQKGLA